MKNNIMVSVVLMGLFLGSVYSVSAAGGGAIVADDFLSRTESPTQASFGLFYDNQTLFVERDDGHTGDIEIDHYYAVLGYDVTDWATLRLRAGGQSLDDMHDTGDGLEYGLGLRARFWAYDVGKILEDMGGRWTMDVFAEYTACENELDDQTVEWGEAFGSLTWNWEFFEEDYSFTDPRAYRFVVSVGVGYSDVTGDVSWDGRSVGWDANGDACFITGADIFLGRHLAFGAEARVYDDPQVLGYITYHF